MTENLTGDETLSRLRSAVGTISESIGKMAATLNSKLDSGEKVETKELKELTAAAKELSAVIRGISDDDEDEDGGTGAVSVEFDGGTDKWAK